MDRDVVRKNCSLGDEDSGKCVDTVVGGRVDGCSIRDDLVVHRMRLEKSSAGDEDQDEEELDETEEGDHGVDDRMLEASRWGIDGDSDVCSKSLYQQKLLLVLLLRSLQQQSKRPAQNYRSDDEVLSVE